MTVKIRIIKTKVCKSCSNDFQPNSGRQEYCTPDCKHGFLYTPVISRKLLCQFCNTNFIATGSTSKFCSISCRSLYKKSKLPSRFCLYCSTKLNIETKQRKFCNIKCFESYRVAQHVTGSEGVDYLTCKICNTKTRELGSHIRIHDISIKEYKQQYNLSTLKTQKQVDQYSGENNPGYQHGGRFSAWSENFKNGYDKNWHLDQIEKHSQLMKDKPELFKFNVEYWISQNNGDEELGKELYLKFQRKDLDFFINHYGEDEGRIRHMKKTEKWMDNFKKCNYSKISQDLFNEISLCIDTTHVYYATHNRSDMEKYINKEYILNVGQTYIRPDFIDLNLKKIIEFDGDYWHSESKANPVREQSRDNDIISSGFEVLHIKEHEYKRNKQKVINECLNFLKQ